MTEFTMGDTTVLDPPKDNFEFWERYRKYMWEYVTIPYYIVNVLVLFIMLALMGCVTGLGWKIMAFMLGVLMLVITRIQSRAISRNVRHRVLESCKKKEDELGVSVMVYINMMDVTSGYFTSFADNKGVHIKQVDTCWVFKEFTQDDGKKSVLVPDRLVVDCGRLKWWYE